MSLSIFSIVSNLMVLNSLREKEPLLSILFNLLLANLCLANLVSTVLVKSVSIVHYAHAVATNSTESAVAFCFLYTVSFRTTWSILPWSIVLLTWAHIQYILNMIQEERDEAKRSAEGLSLDGEDCKDGSGVGGGSGLMDTFSFSSAPCSTNEETKLYDDDDEYKFSMRDKLIVGGLWIMGGVNSMLSEEVLSKNPDKICSIQDTFSSNLTWASILMVLVLPLVLGPLVLLVFRISLFIYTRNTGYGSRIEVSTAKVPSSGFLLGFFLIFGVCYSTNMILSEQSDYIRGNVFLYIMLKYILGTSYQLFVPLWVLIARDDIRGTVVALYRKGGTTQSKSVDLTAEQMQRELGLGVCTG
ncbi:uncharacterized protein LOC111697119 [Eurytemora carolleeae]|uniref:uncharacterized protein LOC111697119 n=1 Tax=Eurytemora carolleeae TaxID=1294199 RepID=UPI000C7742C1|nr:uncharacterized protein LOC111697119 [Eurytemora carolleeae]|eukprot:XP_023322775.1 uncharacterized protein LOC111697119 [Eurytemora affinis]